MDKKIDILKKQLTPYIELFNDLDIYFWFASGVVSDYLLRKIRVEITRSKPFGGLNMFFSSEESRLKVCDFLIERGFKKIKDSTANRDWIGSDRPALRKIKFSLYEKNLPEEHKHLAGWAQHIELHGCWDGVNGDPAVIAKSPIDMINMFDYTIEMIAVDSNKESFSHPDFEDHAMHKKLIRNNAGEIMSLDEQGFHQHPCKQAQKTLGYFDEGYVMDSATVNSSIHYWLKTTYHKRKSRSNNWQWVKKDKLKCPDCGSGFSLCDGSSHSLRSSRPDLDND